MGNIDAESPDDAGDDALGGLSDVLEEERGREPDSIDDFDLAEIDVDEPDDGEGFLSGLLGRGGDADQDDLDEDGDDVEDGPGLLERLRGEDEGPTEPRRAQLVDGATALFIDPEARSKALGEYGLVVLDAAAYEEPVILKNDVPVEIPAGATLCASTSARLLKFDGRRVITRGATLVPPDRVDEVPRDARLDLPAGLDGETVPVRPCQSEAFYRRLLRGMDG